MARPKKNTELGELASKKWRETMLKKYGGKQGLYQAMSKIGAEGGRNGCGPDYKGGFAGDRERAKIAGAKGGRLSRRNEAKRWYDNNKDKMASMADDGMGNREIADALGVSLSKIYYVKNLYGGKR